MKNAGLDDPLDIQANLLNGKWILKDESSAVKDGSIISDQEELNNIIKSYEEYIYENDHSSRY